MARPERQIVSDDVALVEFVQGLRALRGSAGLTLQELSRRAHYSISALSDATNGKRVPTWELTESFVRACGGDVREWRLRWAVTTRRLDPVASQPNGSGPITPSPPPTGSPRASSLKISVVAVVVVFFAVQIAITASFFMTTSSTGMKLVGNSIPTATTAASVSRWYTYGAFQASVGAVVGVGLGWGAALFFKKRARNIARAAPEAAEQRLEGERHSSSSMATNSTVMMDEALSSP